MSDRPEFPPFSAWSGKCPKCGGDDLRTAYHDRTCDRREAKLCCESEHLDRLCQRCRFSWPESVLDPGGRP